MLGGAVTDLVEHGPAETPKSPVAEVDAMPWIGERPCDMSPLRPSSSAGEAMERSWCVLFRSSSVNSSSLSPYRSRRRSIYYSVIPSSYTVPSSSSVSSPKASSSRASLRGRVTPVGKGRTTDGPATTEMHGGRPTEA